MAAWDACLFLFISAGNIRAWCTKEQVIRLSCTQAWNSSIHTKSSQNKQGKRYNLVFLILKPPDLYTYVSHCKKGQGKQSVNQISERVPHSPWPSAMSVIKARCDSNNVAPEAIAPQVFAPSSLQTRIVPRIPSMPALCTYVCSSTYHVWYDT